MLCAAVLKRAFIRVTRPVVLFPSASPCRRRFASTESPIDVRPDPAVTTKTILTNFGFSEDESEKILAACLKRGPICSKSLLETITFWSSLQLPPRDVNSLLMENVDLLFVNEQQGTKMYQFLAEKFSKGQLKNIFLGAPRVVQRNPLMIEEIIKFLELDKNITRDELVRSRALAHSLKHIRSRLEFLERAGLYTVPTKNKVAVGNPKLDWILNTSDRQFATKVAGLSIDEYQVFKELIGKDDEFSSDFDEV